MAKKLISDQLRDAIKRCGKTRYRISKETGIDEAQLSKFFNDAGTSLSLSSIDMVCGCIGVELVFKADSMKPKRSTKKPQRRK